jgi:hypothetical protein
MREGGVCHREKMGETSWLYWRGCQEGMKAGRVMLKEMEEEGEVTLWGARGGTGGVEGGG